MNTDSGYENIEQLRLRIADCRTELLNLLDLWHYLQNIVHPRLMFTYDGIFGDLEYEMEKKSRQACEIERRVELLSIKLRKGERLTEKTIKFIDMVVSKEFERSKRASAPPIPTNGKNGQTRKIFIPADSTDSVGRLYRNIVKRLHPDVVGESEYFRKYWDNVQDAYKKGNVERLKLFHKTLCINATEPRNDPREEERELRRQIRELEISIGRERNKIDKLRTQEPFVWEDKLDDIIWITRRKRRMRERIFQIDRRIQQNKRMLRSLTAGRTTRPVPSNGTIQDRLKPKFAR
ncbi:MAG: hypothetical protein ACLFQX_11740 [Candidatus Kapaibacterium sp.]